MDGNGGLGDSCSVLMECIMIFSPSMYPLSNTSLTKTRRDHWAASLIRANRYLVAHNLQSTMQASYFNTRFSWPGGTNISELQHQGPLLDWALTLL